MARKAKNRSKLASYSRKAAANKKARREKSAAPTPNPPAITSDLTEALSLVVPGLVAYGGTRAGGRVTYNLAAKKWPRLARHLGPVGALATAAALWLASRKVERLQDYEYPAVIGAGIGVAQTILQTYLPVYGWILADYEFKAAAPAALPDADADLVDIEPDEPTPQEGYPGAASASDDDLSDVVSDDYAGSFNGGWN